MRREPGKLRQNIIQPAQSTHLSRAARAYQFVMLPSGRL